MGKPDLYALTCNDRAPREVGSPKIAHDRPLIPRQGKHTRFRIQNCLIARQSGERLPCQSRSWRHGEWRTAHERLGRQRIQPVGNQTMMASPLIVAKVEGPLDFLPTGTVLNTVYTVEALIGNGGFGIVYEGFAPGFGRSRYQSIPPESQRGP